MLLRARTGRTVGMKVFCGLTWRQGLILGENAHGLLTVGNPIIQVGLHRLCWHVGHVGLCAVQKLLPKENKIVIFRNHSIKII